MTYEEEETLDGATPTTDLPGDEFDALCATLAAAKAAEAAATARRIATESQLLKFLPAKQEGTTSRAGADFKVTATFGLNRTIDAAAMDAVRAAMAPQLFDQAVTYKPALVLPGLRHLQNNEPQAYAVLAQAITAKPAKPSLRIEPNKES